MANNNAGISRQDAQVLIETQVADGIFQEVVKSSKALSAMVRLPNMTSKQTKTRVLDTLPKAYWINGDTGKKSITRVAWKDKFITAAEVAVIIPIPEAVLDDASIDIIGQVRPLVIQAFDQKIDEAIIGGVDKPLEWDAGLVDLARNYNHEVKFNPTKSPTELWTKVLDEGGVFSKVEDDGFNVNKIVGSLKLKSKLRSMVDTTGRRIENSTTELEGAPIIYADNGSWDDLNTMMLAGDFTKAVFAIRQDLTMKKLTEAVIQDPSTGEIIYNLAQQDMIALRFVMRLGWATMNPVTTMNGDFATRFPFSILTYDGSATTKKLTFTVKDKASVPAPVVGATISIAGAVKVTDTNGQAVFESFDGWTAETPYTVIKGKLARAENVGATKITSDTEIAIDAFA